MVKRIFFFRGPACFEYDPRPGTDEVVAGPTALGTRFRGLNATFSAGIDAAVNWGDGFVYLFKDSQYYKFDALANRTTQPNPRPIADGWPTFPAAFADRIDAAFNAGNGKAYFFSGNQYLRYDVGTDRVDAPDPGTAAYPRAISDPNGWRGLTPGFESGLDAAVNAGDGKLYFFKDGEYARLTFATRTVDSVAPPYPVAISPAWSGITAPVDCAVEWIQAGAATLVVEQNASCQKAPPNDDGLAALGRAFKMTARFSSTGYPSVCGAAEYRQFVRGAMTLDGADRSPELPDPAGGPPRKLKPRPPGPPSDANFQEDGARGKVRHYGHRAAPPDRFGAYTRPDQRAGCNYDGLDAPLQQGFPGQRVVIDLDFRGVIIDVAAGGELIEEKRWTVFCQDVL